MYSSFCNTAFNKGIVNVNMNNFGLLSIFLILETTMLVAAWNRTEFSQKVFKGLSEVKATCGRLDNCQLKRERDSLELFNCHCGKFCDQLNTCCYDSSYITKQTKSNRFSEKPNKFKCMRVDGERERHVFMVDSCDDTKRRNKKVSENCRNKAEEVDDFNLAIPVTSKKTGITYKNHYCASCNGDESDLVMWRVLLTGNEKVTSIKEPNIHYDSSLQTWTVSNGEGSADKFNVSLGAVAPQEVENVTHTCEANVISSCSDNWRGWWLIDRFCETYMALTMFSDRMYRNPHCAMCNFEDFLNMVCRKTNLKSETNTVNNNLFEK